MVLFPRRRARSTNEATTLIKTIMSKMQIYINHYSIRMLLTAIGISKANGLAMDKTAVL